LAIAATLMAAACREHLRLEDTSGAGGPLTPSMWGGDQAGLVVSDTGATLTFACAVGTIAGSIELDAAGHFSVSGIYALTPGPAYLPHPATYEGTVRGDRMTMSVIVPEISSDPLGPFALVRGVPFSGPVCL
jgi:hypothetical protein